MSSGTYKLSKLLVVRFFGKTSTIECLFVLLTAVQIVVVFRPDIITPSGLTSTSTLIPGSYEQWF